MHPVSIVIPTLNEAEAIRAVIRESPQPDRGLIGGASKVAGSIKGALRASARFGATYLRVASRPAPRA